MQRDWTTSFYTGFKGEPEITFIRTGDGGLCLQAWYGYFARVLEAIKPGSDGEWHGLPLHYHLETGWYDEQEFELPDLALFISQLVAIDATVFEPATQRFYEALLGFLQQAVAAREKVLLAYS